MYSAPFAAPVNVTPSSFVSSVLSAVRARLVCLSGTNGNAADRIIQLFDRASGAPNAGDSPIVSFRVAPGAWTAGLEVLSYHGLQFVNGIVVATSTRFDLYAAGSADLSVNAWLLPNIA